MNRSLYACLCSLATVGAMEIAWAQLPAPKASAAAAARPDSPNPAPVESRSTAPANAVNAPIISSAAGDYVLSSADTIEMTVFREPDLTTRSRIASDGTVQLPLIGDVKVAGLTIREARESIRKRYDADYLVSPQVYLNIVDYAQRKFTILGQVVKPGTYEFPGGRTLSLLEAVGMAGGFTRSADRGRIIAKRANAREGETTIKLNAKKLAAEGKESFELLPGDVITVGESWF